MAKKKNKSFNFKRILILILVLVALIFVFFAFSTTSRADNYSTDFENFTLGSINNQQGWKVSGSVDQAIVSQSQFSDFGNQSFRISNNLGYGTAYFVLSNLVQNSAGESTVAGTGIIQPNFKAEWDFTSANPSITQTGLIVDARIDEGKITADHSNGISKIRMSDTDTGLKVEIEDLNGLFVVAKDLDRTVTHHIKVTLNFVNGTGNDVASVCVDNDLTMCKTVGSYEGLYSTPLAVRAVAFRPQSPSTGKEGFLIDNFSILSWGNEPTIAPTEVPTVEPTVIPSVGVPTVEPTNSVTQEPVKPPKNLEQCKKDGWTVFNNPVFPNQGQCIKYVLKNEWKELKNQDETKWDLIRDQILQDWSN